MTTNMTGKPTYLQSWKNRVNICFVKRLLAGSRMNFHRRETGPCQGAFVIHLSLTGGLWVCCREFTAQVWIFTFKFLWQCWLFVCYFITLLSKKKREWFCKRWMNTISNISTIHRSQCKRVVFQATRTPPPNDFNQRETHKEQLGVEITKKTSVMSAGSDCAHSHTHDFRAGHLPWAH